MMTIIEVYNDFRKSSDYDSNWVLKCYEKHNLYINYLDSFNNEEELRLFIWICFFVSRANFERKRFNDTIQFAESKMLVIDQYIWRQNAFDQKNEFYYGIKNYNGMANYRLKDFKVSTAIFTQLLQEEPRNDDYQNWLNHSKKQQSRGFRNSLYIIFFLILAIEMIYSRFSHNSTFAFIMLIMSTVGFTVLLLYDFVSDGRSRRKKK
jgi:hypothetical protein